MAALEARVTELIERSHANAEQRLMDYTAAAEARLAAVEHAQQREEEVRARTAAAEQESERRVREAEQRLIDVMARLDTPGDRLG